MALRIYVGETDLVRGLFKHNIYNDADLPDYLKKLLEENPVIKARFPKFEDFAKRRPPGSRSRRVVQPVPILGANPPIRRK
jgi:hypothetical protein